MSMTPYWEYKRTRLDRMNEDIDLQNLGADGWELVLQDDQGYFIFKRGTDQRPAFRLRVRYGDSVSDD